MRSLVVDIVVASTHVHGCARSTKRVVDCTQKNGRGPVNTSQRDDARAPDVLQSVDTVHEPSRVFARCFLSSSPAVSFSSITYHRHARLDRNGDFRAVDRDLTPHQEPYHSNACTSSGTMCRRRTNRPCAPFPRGRRPTQPWSWPHQFGRSSECPSYLASGFAALPRDDRRHRRLISRDRRFAGF